MKTSTSTITLYLTNDFHNTDARLRVKDLGGYAILSESQCRRAAKRLCPWNDCLCGDYLGQRGPNAKSIEVEYDHTTRQDIVKISTR